FEPDELRAHIGAMFQDYVDYQATAAENIGLGSVQELTDRDAVISASKQAGSDELISGLPAGYDTALGKWFDAGVNLSGGEWQKVALARAFMRENARILLLDEPTSALDAQAEYDLFERLRSLTHGRTAVYISHRFSTVRRADRIVFLEHGRLVEEGTQQATIPLAQIAGNDHVLVSLWSHLIYSLTGTRSEVIYRLLPAIAAGATAGVTATVLVERFGVAAGVSAGLYVATNPMFVENSRDLRGYSVATLFGLLATIVFFGKW